MEMRDDGVKMSRQNVDGEGEASKQDALKTPIADPEGVCDVLSRGTPADRSRAIDVLFTAVRP